MERSTRRADETIATQTEVVVLLPRLPDHFATTFAYAAESSAGPSRRTLDSASGSKNIDENSKPAPRRSSRARQTRVPDLTAFAESEADSNQARLSSARSKMTTSRARTKMLTASDYNSDSSSVEVTRSKKPRKRIKRTRDDPNSATGSIYAHLKGLPDLFAEHNDIMFCGINPGVKSSSSGHHFAHRSNHFYPSLHLAGITEHRMTPEQDVEFPHLEPFSLGLTNLAGRPTAEGAELLPSELIAGVPLLLEKVLKWKPKTVCFVGKGISEAFMKGLKQARAIKTSAQRNMKRSTRFRKSPTQRVESQGEVKMEEVEPNLATKPEQSRDDRDAPRLMVSADIPSSVLLASSTSALKEESNSQSASATLKPLPSPQKKASKVIYTKGNSKDDVGYGLLPICVPHSASRCSTRSIPSLRDVTLFFVTPSSSARVTTHFLEDKARILSSLRVLVQHLDSTYDHDQRNSSSLNGVVKKEEEEEMALTRHANGLHETSNSMEAVELEVVDVTAFGL